MTLVDPPKVVSPDVAQFLSAPDAAELAAAEIPETDEPLGPWVSRMPVRPPQHPNRRKLSDEFEQHLGEGDPEAPPAPDTQTSAPRQQEPFGSRHEHRQPRGPRRDQPRRPFERSGRPQPDHLPPQEPQSEADSSQSNDEAGSHNPRREGRDRREGGERSPGRDRRNREPRREPRAHATNSPPRNTPSDDFGDGIDERPLVGPPPDGTADQAADHEAPTGESAGNTGENRRSRHRRRRRRD